LGQMVEVVKARAEEAEESMMSARDKIKVLGQDNKTMAEKIR
jgi:hypothetical protein